MEVAINEAITINDFVANWKDDFIERIYQSSKSRKQDFNYSDALKYSSKIRTDFDKVMIDYLHFISNDPLNENDYYKYLNSYINGKKLSEKYFRHDAEVLKYYYDKVGKNKEYNPFHVKQYETYVLFMMLKFSQQYDREFDVMFNVISKDGREYNPLCNCPTHIRSEMPITVKEYDIARAYPTFIFMELKMKPFDVYEKIGKKDFNRLLNTHSGTECATIESVREKLRPIYGERVNEVITEHRFNNQGQMFRDMTKYEEYFINKFIESNSLKTYVRLHDGVIVLPSVKCEVLEFGEVIFKEKQFIKPQITNHSINFYNINNDGKINTTPATYARFFEQEGFIRITRESHDQLTILKNENRVLSPINHKTDIVPFLKSNINEYDPEPIEDRIARDANTTIQQALQLLNPIPLSYHKDTKERCDIPFKNGIVRITADKVEVISYDEIEGFFAKHSTQKHEITIKKVEDVHSDFSLFLEMAITGKDFDFDLMTAEEKTTISSFYSMIGYLISNYKDPANNFGIILSDDDANGETRNGGRGKSLLQKALTYFRCSIEKGGLSYDPKYTHVHADLKKEHDLYLIDDVPANFDWLATYTNITGGIDAQRKGVTAETITFEDAPKFIFSTNYAVRYDSDATSTNRRFIEYKFTNFWNINNKPNDYFNESFFTDWNIDQWNDFYNFGFYCVQYYLKNGLKSIEYDKKADNYRAYFYNDSVEFEAERIFERLKSEDSFNVTDFVNIHRDNHLFNHDSIFTTRNAKKYIDSFIEFRDISYSYSKRIKKWERNV